ncbi:tetratricopeptide repeat protein, partial [bacterium]|nr:tetratricopeptide repeat protein [bacterium]
MPALFSGSDHPNRRIPWRRLGPWLLVLVVFLAYANSLSAPFLFDDVAAIVENPTIRQLWPPPGPLRTPPGSAACGRPVVNVTLAVNYALGGLQVRGYRLVNTGLHALAACLLFGLVRRTLSGPRLGPRWGHDARSLALALAAIWAVHPLQTSTVTY